MNRYFMTVEYDGSNYFGFQRQENLPTIQGALEQALERFLDCKTTIYGAGRTDTGVHALGQVCHFDSKKEWDGDRVVDALNFYLTGESISVLHSSKVASGLHARFSALRRGYVYKILQRRSPPALDKNRVWHIRQPLNIALMKEGAKLLLGQHDYATFCPIKHEHENTVRSIDTIDVQYAGDILEVRIIAKSFLHHQVRNIIGSLYNLGTGKWSVQDLAEALAAKDRRRGGITAPACGLYFEKVEYDGY